VNIASLGSPSKHHALGVSCKVKLYLSGRLQTGREEVKHVKFVIKKSPSSGQYWFRIVASNGQVLASSEQYVAKQSAKDAIASVKANAASATIEDET